MKEVTFEITDYCPHECSYCSTNAGPNGGIFIDAYEVEKHLFVYGPFDRINISGGEPLAHPDFYSILLACKKRLTPGGLIYVFTNAIQGIIYNANILEGVRVEANVPVLPGTDKVHVLRMIPQGREAKRPDVHFSRNWENKDCRDCEHRVVRPDGMVAHAPCKKNHGGTEDTEE